MNILEWLITIIIIVIAFIPVVYRLNQRLYTLEQKVNEMKAQRERI